MLESFKDTLVAQIPRLRAYATGLCGSSVEADDLVQDSLIRAWRFRENYQLGTNLSAWLFHILKNEFITQRLQRRPPMQDIDETPGAQLSTPPAQEWSVRCTETLAMLQRLPADNRDALLLVAAAGLSYQEAAAVSGCDVAVLKGRVHRARLRLLELTTAKTPASPADRPRASRSSHLLRGDRHAYATEA